MHPAIREKLASLRERHEELNALLADPATAANADLLRRYAQEHAQIAPVITILDDTARLEQELAGLAELAYDPDMAELVAAERPQLEAQIAANEQTLARHMIPKDPLDGADVYLEIRAGTGGDEAAPGGDRGRYCSALMLHSGGAVSAAHACAGITALSAYRV